MLASCNNIEPVTESDLQLFFSGLGDVDVYENNGTGYGVDFGDVPNHLISGLHDKIEAAVKKYITNGNVCILSTQGQSTTLLTVLLFPTPIHEDKLILKIEHI